MFPIIFKSLVTYAYKTNSSTAPSPCRKSELTQVEVRGLWRDGEGRGLKRNLTAGAAVGTDWRLRLLESLPVTVHLSLERQGTQRTRPHVQKKHAGTNAFRKHSSEKVEKRPGTVKQCPLTSLGRPPGLRAMVLANSGDTHRTGERIALLSTGSPLWPFWYCPSLVVRRRMGPGAWSAAGPWVRTPARPRGGTGRRRRSLAGSAPPASSRETGAYMERGH